jgi:hypothetical protein
MYLIDSFGSFLSTGYNANVALFTFVGEVLPTAPGMDVGTSHAVHADVTIPLVLGRIEAGTGRRGFYNW